VNTFCGSVDVAQFAILFPTIALAFWVQWHAQSRSSTCTQNLSSSLSSGVSKRQKCVSFFLKEKKSSKSGGVSEVNHRPKFSFFLSFFSPIDTSSGG